VYPGTLALTSRPARPKHRSSQRADKSRGTSRKRLDLAQPHRQRIGRDTRSAPLTSPRGAGPRRTFSQGGAGTAFPTTGHAHGAPPPPLRAITGTLPRLRRGNMIRLPTGRALAPRTRNSLRTSEPQPQRGDVGRVRTSRPPAARAPSPQKRHRSPPHIAHNGQTPPRSRRTRRGE